MIIAILNIFLGELSVIMDVYNVNQNIMDLNVNMSNVQIHFVIIFQILLFLHHVFFALSKENVYNQNKQVSVPAILNLLILIKVVFMANVKIVALKAKIYNQKQEYVQNNFQIVSVTVIQIKKEEETHVKKYFVLMIALIMEIALMDSVKTVKVAGLEMIVAFTKQILWNNDSIYIIYKKINNIT